MLADRHVTDALSPMIRRVTPVTALAVAAGLVVGLLCIVVIGAIGAVVLAVGVGAGLALGLRIELGAAPRMLRTLGATSAPVDRYPRLHNTVDGLCLAQGIEPPDLYVLDLGVGNAATLGSPRPALVLTRGALEALEVVELEGLVAHLLARTRDGDLVHRSVAATFAGLPGVRRAARRWANHDHTVGFDQEAVAMTRYPPGLQRALQALAALGTDVPAAPTSSAHLWVLPPGGTPSQATDFHPDVDLRLAALEEA
tara:strand:- start:3920 stop:4684 length:765 start_codon:yes stop_codon:yes gene_type:complete